MLARTLGQPGGPAYAGLDAQVVLTAVEQRQNKATPQKPLSAAAESRASLVGLPGQSQLPHGMRRAQDEALADAAEALLAYVAVVDLGVLGGALLYSSRGLEQLAGLGSGPGSGSSKGGGAGWAALLEQGPGSDALRAAAKSGVVGGSAVALVRPDGSRHASLSYPTSCRIPTQYMQSACV